MHISCCLNCIIFHSDSKIVSLCAHTKKEKISWNLHQPSHLNSDRNSKRNEKNFLRDSKDYFAWGIFWKSESGWKREKWYLMQYRAFLDYQLFFLMKTFLEWQQLEKFFGRTCKVCLLWGLDSGDEVCTTEKILVAPGNQDSRYHSITTILFTANACLHHTSKRCPIIQFVYSVITIQENLDAIFSTSPEVSHF